MKENTVVWTEVTGLGIYLYPHETPIEDDTICSIINRDNTTVSNLAFLLKFQ